MRNSSRVGGKLVRNSARLGGKLVRNSPAWGGKLVGANRWCWGEVSLPVCFPECDPLAPGCGPGEACFLSPSGDSFFCHASLEALSEPGEPCDGEVFCVTGLTCLGAKYFESCASDYCCAPWCDIENPDVAAVCDAAWSGTSCTPYPGTLAREFDHLGLCLPPP